MSVEIKAERVTDTTADTTTEPDGIPEDFRAAISAWLTGTSIPGPESASKDVSALIREVSDAITYLDARDGASETWGQPPAIPESLKQRDAESPGRGIQGTLEAVLSTLSAFAVLHAPVTHRHLEAVLSSLSAIASPDALKAQALEELADELTDIERIGEKRPMDSSESELLRYRTSAWAGESLPLGRIANELRSRATRLRGSGDKP